MITLAKICGGEKTAKKLKVVKQKKKSVGDSCSKYPCCYFPPVYPPLKPVIITQSERVRAHRPPPPFNTTLSTPSALKGAVSRRATSCVFYCCSEFPAGRVCLRVPPLEAPGVTWACSYAFIDIRRLFLIFPPVSVFAVAAILFVIRRYLAIFSRLSDSGGSAAERALPYVEQ